MEKEFERQIKNLINLNFHELIGINEEKFNQKLEALRPKLEEIKPSENEKIPFVIVIKKSLLANEISVPLIKVDHKKALINLTPVNTSHFEPISQVELPQSDIYLLAGIDTGKDTLNVTPREALKILTKKDLTPLTIDEGIAVLTHFPEKLTKNNCFYTSGSRGNDKKVPAFWITKTNIRLGWCWEGNPQTWLGTASGEKRL